MSIQYIPRNMHRVFALLCFVVVIFWLIFPYQPGLLHWHWGNLTIAPVPAKQPWWMWINTSCEFLMNDCITTTKQSTTKPCAYFFGYTVHCNSHASRPRMAPWSISSHGVDCLWQAIGVTAPIFITTVKPVYNDHLVGYLPAFWSSSWWPGAT